MCLITSRKQQGFTLIEIMVVVVIIAIFAGITAISLRTESPQRVLKSEGKRLNQVLRIALDEAQIQAIQVGLLFDQEGYQFYSLQSRRWVPFANDKAMARHKWPDNITADLTLEGFAAFSENPEENINKGLTDRLERERLLEEEASFNGDGKNNDDEDSQQNDNNTNNKPKKIKVAEKPPQIFILSSGEITPFSILLQFDHEGMDHPVFLEFKGDYSGTIKMSETLEARPRSQ